MKKESAYSAYLPFFILYFFFNNFLLKEGLLYTSLLVPVFLYWLYKNHALNQVIRWSVLLVLPIPFHLWGGADLTSYLVSSLMVAAAWIFLFTAIMTVRETRKEWGDIFRNVLFINSLLLFIALVFLPFPVLREWMWNAEPMSASLPPIPRLKMLAYEPSHYGLLLAPVFLFFLLRVITGQTKHPLLLAGAVLLPLLLSLSFGIIGTVMIAMILGVLVCFGKLSTYSKRLTVYGISFFIVITGIFLLAWPENPVFVRAENIFSGADSSSKGRLVYSFMFARDLILQHDPVFGVGPGQVKILAHDLIVNFYQYTGRYAETVRIPNSMGEMMATYGFLGLILKIILEIYFFIRLKIYRNLYSLVLFLFIFIYQFTGSFLVNAAEIGAWALAFNSRAEEFDLQRLNPGTS